MSPIKPFTHQEPPPPTPKHSIVAPTTTTIQQQHQQQHQQQYQHNQHQQQSHMFLFDNIPHGVSASDGENSTFSLPNVPSPLSEPSPSIANLPPTMDAATMPHHYQQQQQQQQHHRTPASSYPPRSHRNDEEDTFFDDRSLEQRIHQSLQGGPTNNNYTMVKTTPASVPITPSAQDYERLGWTSESATSIRHQQYLQQQRQHQHGQIPHNTPRTTASAALLHEEQDLVETNDNIDANMDEKLMSHRASMAILKLKTDLRNSIHQTYLLQQEKDALQIKLRDLQTNLHSLQDSKEAADQRLQTLDNSNRQLEKLQQESNQLLQTTNQQLQESQQQQTQQQFQLETLQKDLTASRKENKELSERLKDLSTFNSSTEGRLTRLRKELDAALIDNSSFQKELAKFQELAIEREQSLREHQAKSQADLEDLTEQRNSYLQQIEQLEVTMKSAKSQSDDRIRELESQHQDFKQKSEADTIELIRLRTALKESSQQSTKANFKSETQNTTLQKQLEAQQQTISELKAELEEVNECVEKQTEQLEVAQEQVQQAQAQLMATHRHLPHTVTSTRSDVGDSILDRLARIRDAADRASLVKEHHREMARMREDYESKIAKLSTKLNQRLEDSMSSTKMELLAKHTVKVETLQSEYESRLATQAKRHYEEINTLKEEHAKSSKVSEASLSAAMSKLTATKHKLEREFAKREQIQATIHRLENQMVSEKEKLSSVHQQEVKELRSKWEAEKDVLLVTIQRECNTVFDEKRKRPLSVTDKAGSPRSVDYDFSKTDTNIMLAGDLCGEDLLVETDSIAEEVKTERKSAVYSFKVDEELRETEALVQSLLGAKKDGE